MLADALELLLPLHCAGCGASGDVLCPRCRAELARPPYRVSPRIAVPRPVFALGPYNEVRRQIVLAMKERGNRAVRPYVGAVLRAGVENLLARGELVAPFTLVPAPTRARRARLRGGDHVLDCCRATGFPTERLVAHYRVRDQEGLDAQQRRANLARGVRVTHHSGVNVLLIDDVVTTGATLAATVHSLTYAQFNVVGALCFASA